MGARPADQTTGSRVAALDGLRGLVIITVVLNHAVGKLWPRGPVYDVPVLEGLLTGGAVTVFFVVGAFIVTRNLVREYDDDRLDPVRFYVRRLIRLGVQIVPLCGVLVALDLFDDSYRGTTRNLVENVTHLMTYTFNLWGSDDLLGTRPEVGHLWYLSVQQQAYLVLPLVLLLFLRWRPALIGSLIILALACFAWRQVVIEREGWIVASTLTSTRVDAVVWGVSAALLLPYTARWGRWPGVVAWCAAALVGLKLVLSELPELAFLGVWSVAFMVVAAALVLAIWNLDRPTRVSRFLSYGSLRVLGKSSLTIYVWHLPVFVVLARHTAGWAWPIRTITGLAILVAIVIVLERLVEEPTRRFLASSQSLRMPARSSNEHVPGHVPGAVTPS
ncbi:Peptidoglycan/LPS O-acetylase OafA/YrhL, contains acyltransferase and SGNH-hydrolase domains [Nocardioides exalbidus]|uniref:Peptidoglycan/LPS O-acetylase OafA/YrhL, contains acyltransferase and SGNH-hydrolase domains n=1 Tax=Nocardioides exalbidus TaxID=402596 RepID=A0A1H4XA25_9ACTN|nr:acyltransferase [Nocardioides exalbidus]SED02433.1 Peptidoglycan/LPS O-acetylase OafA/YrhL, contains acyltransferase and SGNH-hydrolase domains [Nocardioides exalbidus]